MVNANGGKNHTQDIHDKERLDERQSEATSDETLNDLEEAETDVSSTDTDLDPGPSPDGMLNEPDEIKDGRDVNRRMALTQAVQSTNFSLLSFQNAN